MNTGDGCKRTTSGTTVNQVGSVCLLLAQKSIVAVNVVGGHEETLLGCGVAVLLCARRNEANIGPVPEK